MQKDIVERINNLQDDVADATKRLDIAGLQKEYQVLQSDSQGTDFWQNVQLAQEKMKRLAQLETLITPWLDLTKNIDDIKDLVALGDRALEADLETQLQQSQRDFDALKHQLKFSGRFDSFDAIISIYAGAGGTDAQDWAQMLFRMYTRWSEMHNFKLTVDDESAGEEAGLKSITFEITGDFVYGRLKSEHGVHRLVRLSPFNADNLRQTSFAKVDVLPKVNQPETIDLDEKDLKIDVYRSGGHGGQSVNTTDSAVRVTHLPTGIVVSIQNERSQLQNKETAFTILRSRLAQLQLEQHRDDLRDLKGPNQSAEWGNQIRSYVLHPYKQVKDLRSRYETSDIDSILNGDLDDMIEAYLDYTLGTNH